MNGKNEYQDLDDKPAPKDDPPSTYQPLSAEEEAKLEQPVKVNIEPEVESAPAEVSATFSVQYNRTPLIRNQFFTKSG